MYDSLSNSNKGIVTAFNKGYRVTFDGKIISPFSGKYLKTMEKEIGGCRYEIVSLYHEKGKRTAINVGRIVAYQKYGNEVFKEGIECRHLDGNGLNNSYSNISIGTKSENMMDKPKEVRLESAITASNYIRKFTDEVVDEIRLFYNECRSYKKVMEKFDISSKGTLYYILNNNYVTTKKGNVCLKKKEL